METIKLNDDIYTEFHILKRSEWDAIGKDYKGNSIYDSSVKMAFLPGYGTTLFFENKHFLIIDDREPVEKFAIWRNHKVIGYCEITEKARQKNNGANNAVFYIGHDAVTNPEKYKTEKEAATV